MSDHQLWRHLGPPRREVSSSVHSDYQVLGRHNRRHCCGDCVTQTVQYAAAVTAGGWKSTVVLTPTSPLRLVLGLGMNLVTHVWEEVAERLELGAGGSISS